MRTRHPGSRILSLPWKTGSRLAAWSRASWPVILGSGLARVLGGCSEVDYVLGTVTTEAVDLDSGVGSGPFGPPEAVVELADPTYAVSNPTFPESQLELYFTAARPGGPGSEDIWVARRSSSNQPWGSSAPVLALSSPSIESGLGIASDGLTLWFSSDRPGGVGKMDVWVASRPDAEAAWSTPVAVPELSSPEDDLAHPAMGSPLVMFVASKRLNPPDWDLLIASRASAESPWQTPIPLAEVNSPALDVDPFLSKDNGQLFFNSARGDTGEDLYWSPRDPVTSRFSAPEPLVELNSPASERDPWLTPDLRTILFCSNRSGVYQIYQARR
jgi:hypothetical protein